MFFIAVVRLCVNSFLPYLDARLPHARAKHLVNRGTVSSDIFTTLLRILLTSIKIS